ncbi:Os10g0494400, partial [Oryza sativa Japonica Group]
HGWSGRRQVVGGVDDVGAERRRARGGEVRPAAAGALALHPAPRDVAAHPRGDVLADLDHGEEEEAVDEDHAEEHGEVQPLGSAHVDLEHVLQDVLAGDLGELVVLVVEHQALQVVLVLTLQQLVEADV